MSTISLRLPASLHNKVRDLAKSEDVSINQLITTALAEKMSALMTVDYLEERAVRGDRVKFERAMGKVADVEPEDADRLVMPNKRIEQTARRARKKRVAGRSLSATTFGARQHHLALLPRSTRNASAVYLNTTGGYTPGMKTAISIPDDVFNEAEALARRTKKSRSEVYARAVREYVARHSADK